MKKKKTFSERSNFFYLTCAFNLILFSGCSSDSYENKELYLSLPEKPYDYVSLPSSGVPPISI